MKKKTVGTVLKTIVIVVAVVLLIITGFLYFVDTPVVEEGQEPTVAQKIILLGKKYLGEILAIFGISAVALMGVLTKLIYNAVLRAGSQAQNTSADVASVNARLDRQEKIIEKLLNIIIANGQKQDLANTTLLTTFSLSELPVSLREQIHSAQTEYSRLQQVTTEARQIVGTVENTAENKSEPVTEEAESSNEQTVDETPETEQAKSPVFI